MKLNIVYIVEDQNRKEDVQMSKYYLFEENGQIYAAWDWMCNTNENGEIVYYTDVDKEPAKLIGSGECYNSNHLKAILRAERLKKEGVTVGDILYF